MLPSPPPAGPTPHDDELLPPHREIVRTPVVAVKPLGNWLSADGKRQHVPPAPAANDDVPMTEVRTSEYADSDNVDSSARQTPLYEWNGWEKVYTGPKNRGPKYLHTEPRRAAAGKNHPAPSSQMVFRAVAGPPPELGTRPRILISPSSAGILGQGGNPASGGGSITTNDTHDEAAMFHTVNLNETNPPLVSSASKKSRVVAQQLITDSQHQQASPRAAVPTLQKKQ